MQRMGTRETLNCLEPVVIPLNNYVVNITNDDILLCNYNVITLTIHRKGKFNESFNCQNR